MNDFLIRVTKEGEITYPDGCSNIWEAQRKVNDRLTQRYLKQLDQEREQALKPVLTQQEIAQQAELKRKADRMENLYLVKAYFNHRTWKDRIEYLALMGYEYNGKQSSIAKQLSKNIETLMDTGQWDELIKVVRTNETSSINEL